MIDPDGDPAGGGGVRRIPASHNWLDTTGHQSGVLQFRWSGTKAAPEFAVRMVAADSLDDVLPAGVARTTPEQRADAVRARQAGVQLRDVLVGARRGASRSRRRPK